MKFFKSFLIFLFTLNIVNSQEQRTIEIIQAGKSIRNSTDFPGANILQRDNNLRVILFHDGARIESDLSYYYFNENSFKANGKVIFNQGDSLLLTSDFLEYDGKTKKAFAYGDVLLTRPDMKLETDTLYLDRTKNIAFYNSRGKIIDNENTLRSNSGTYFMGPKKYIFKSNVTIENPEYNVDSEELEYFTESNYTYFNDKTLITGVDYSILCKNGFYDTYRQKGFFRDNAVINYDGKIIYGDSIFFENEKSYASATNNVRINDTINNSIITGHYGEIFKAKDSAIITMNALAVNIIKSDSLYIHSDTITITGPDEKKILKGYYDVRILKSDVRGLSDSIHFNQETGLIKLLKQPKSSKFLKTLTDEEKNKINPIIWFGKNQITGDQIFLKSNMQTEELDSLIIRGNVFMSQKDSLVNDRFNQIKGEKLDGFFRDGTLDNVYIVKNSTLLYYMYSDEGEFIGMNNTLASSILIRFKENEISEVSFYRNPDGNVISENKIILNEMKLPGFIWREDEKPETIYDLFSEDDKELEIIEIE
jgi:lipopolysaccharide export system protein LptA